MKDIGSMVEYYRNTVIYGECIDLVPYLPEHAMDVVQLRNRPEVRYFLNQECESTLESQNAWHDGYLKRANDIFWVIQNKGGQFVGTNRLYDISSEYAEKGSQIVAQEYARSLPIALESDLLIIKIAINTFGVGSVLACVRNDNEKVISMNERLGFRKIKSKIINNVNYDVLRLNRSFFQPAEFDRLINYWGKRDERRNT